MLNWIRCHSVGLLTASFVLGALASVLFAILGGDANARPLGIGGLVCAGALVITLLARIVIWCAKKFMPQLLTSMRWHELTLEQFRSIGNPARIAFVSQHVGLFAVALGFGWLFASMGFVILWGN